MIADRYDKDPEKWAGKPTDPKRFNEIEIAKRKLSYGKAGFALQFMLNTNLSDYEKYPLKVSDLIVDTLDMKESSIKWSWANGMQQLIPDVPCVALKGDLFYYPLSRSQETATYTGAVMFIDPSGRGKDETAYAILKYLNGYLFLMEVDGYTEGYSDTTLRQLAQKAKFWGVNEVVVEGNFGDGMFIKVMTPVFNKIYPCLITEVKNTKQKELRIIDTLEPVLMQHRLIVNRSVIDADFKTYERNQNYSLFYQMTRLCRDKNALAHDDRLDALCGGIAYWTEKMDIMEDTQKESWTEDQLLDFIENGVINTLYENERNNSTLYIKNVQIYR